MKRRVTLLLAIGVAAVLALEAVPFYTDWLWFEEVGYWPSSCGSPCGAGC